MPSLPRPEVDLHTHTVASGHAYSTIMENARAAAEIGLRGLGMADHGPALPGAPHPYHFAALRFLPEFLYGVRILRGVEANILDDGRIDLDDERLATLELVLAGFHEECGYASAGTVGNTRTLLRLIRSRKVHVISHPGNPFFPIDYAAVAETAAEHGVAIEINNASFGLSRKGGADNCRFMAECCARFATPVAINSDAHIAVGVGDVSLALSAAAAAGIEPEQIVNRTLESTLDFLGLPRP